MYLLFPGWKNLAELQSISFQVLVRKPKKEARRKRERKNVSFIVPFSKGGGEQHIEQKEEGGVRREG